MARTSFIDFPPTKCRRTWTHSRSPLWLQEHSPLLTLLVGVSSGLAMTWKIRAPETSKYMTLALWGRLWRSTGVTHLCSTDVHKQHTSSSHILSLGAGSLCGVMELTRVRNSNLFPHCPSPQVCWALQSRKNMQGRNNGTVKIKGKKIFLFFSERLLGKSHHQCSHTVHPADNLATGVWFSCKENNSLWMLTYCPTVPLSSWCAPRCRLHCSRRRSEAERCRSAWLQRKGGTGSWRSEFARWSAPWGTRARLPARLSRRRRRCKRSWRQQNGGLGITSTL